jgi:hypothetical protein
MPSRQAKKEFSVRHTINDHVLSFVGLILVVYHKASLLFSVLIHTLKTLSCRQLCLPFLTFMYYIREERWLAAVGASSFFDILIPSDGAGDGLLVMSIHFKARHGWRKFNDEMKLFA